MDDVISLYSLSNYAENLNDEDRRRYLQKLQILNIDCPYKIPDSVWKTGNDLDEILPPLSIDSLFHYLIVQRSSITGEQFSSFRSLGAQQYIKNGWIQHMAAVLLRNGAVLCKAKVHHSMAISRVPLTPWMVLLKKRDDDSDIITAHCNCVAGLGEVCVHIGALAYLCEHMSEQQKFNSVTSKPCRWNKPSTKTPVPHVFAHEISTLKTNKQRVALPPPTEEEIEKCCRSLATEEKPSVILSLIPEYMHLFKMPEPEGGFPKPLSTLYNHSNSALSMAEISEECDRVYESLIISEEQSNTVEQLTRNQSNSPHWYRHRAGRITASMCKSVIKSNVDNPSTQLIKRICYTDSSRLPNSPSLNWGRSKESTALQRLKKLLQKQHKDVEMKKVGLIISLDHPFLAASPDAFFTCSCHGKFIVEVKCPYSSHGGNIRNAAETDRNFFLSYCPDTKSYYLKCYHAYYYQVQMQLLVTGCQQGFFAVWEPNDIVVVSVKPDAALFSEILEKSAIFFQRVLLPELVAHVYTSKVLPTNLTNPVPYFPCYCQTERDQEAIVSCSNVNCIIRTFHVTCVGLTAMPMIWKCKDCSKEDRLAAKKKRNGNENAIGDGEANRSKRTDQTIPRKPLKTIN